MLYKIHSMIYRIESFQITLENYLGLILKFEFRIVSTICLLEFTFPEILDNHVGFLK